MENQAGFREVIAERKQRIARALHFIRPSHIYFILASAVILFGVYIRTRNLGNLEWKYPLALDPYVFLRYAHYILENGALMQVDMMRYYPQGFDVISENMMISYVFVWLYKLLSLFSASVTLEAAAIIYPVVSFGIAMVFYYLLARMLFNQKIALISTAILSVIPSFLYRTMAGFSDKEAIGILFMFSSMYFYVRSFRSEIPAYSLCLASISGILTGLMGITWGGFKFLLLIIPGYVLAMILISRPGRKDFFSYLAWLIIFTIFAAFFTRKYGGLAGLLTSTTTGICYITSLVFMAYLLVSNNRVRLSVYLSAIMKKRKGLYAVGIVFSAFLLIFLFFGPALVLVNDIKGVLISGMGGDRLMMTVAEAKVPYFTDWLYNFGVFLLLFFFGSVYLFYITFRKALGKTQAALLTVLYGAVLAGLMASRYSPYSRLSGKSVESLAFMFVPLLLFGIALVSGYLYLLIRNPGSFSGLKELDDGYIFTIIWLAVMMIAARSGMRLFMVLAPVASLVGGFAVISLFEFSSGLKDRFYRYFAYFVLLLFIVPTVFGFAMESLSQSRLYAPSFNQQWRDAMEWVYHNTTEEAVFAHWWDYGYWVQSQGGRATITDGGNFIPYWNHLMGRHVLAAGSGREALEFLYVHNATHLLIVSDEIQKYTAYSSIGSDENFDIFSWIGTFIMEPDSTKNDPATEIVDYYFKGSVALDEDLVYEGRVYPKKESYILRFRVPVLETEEKIEILQPYATVYHKGSAKELPLECIYDEGKILFNSSGLGGCIRIFPWLLGNGYQRENGALLYVSEKGVNALWTRLFLFDEEIEGFRLVYDDSESRSLAYYGGSIYGPLRIWEIEYPDNFTIDPDLAAEYLSTSTPRWMNLSRISLLAE